MNKLSAIDEFSKESNLSKDLRVKVRNYIKSKAECEGFKWFDKKEIFYELPKNLRYEIALVMYKGSANFLNFFKYQNSTFVSSVVPFLRHTIVDKDTFVYNIGDYADEIYFLMRGKVTISDSDGTDVMSLLPGGNFGDIEVVMQKNRIFSVRTESKCSLLVMNYDILDMIQNRFLAVWHDLELQAYENFKIYTLLQRNIAELRNKIERGDSEIKNLKGLGDFLDPFLEKEFIKESNWSLDKEMMGVEEKALHNLETTKKSLSQISITSTRTVSIFDLILNSLRHNCPVRSFSNLEEIPIFCLEN